jgi:amino acid adenylation domain-containing protein
VPGFEPFPDEALAATVGARFLETADRWSDRTALRSPAGSWTFAELAEQVRRNAAGVQELVDDGTSQPVAILAAHDGPLVAAILAIIVAGHVVVVVDPLAPPEQAAHVIDESGAALVLHDSTHAEAAATLAGAVPGGRAVDLELVGTGADHFRAPDAGPDDPAMLAFTSGTSGASKAGIITHGVLLNMVRGATNALGVTPDDRMPMLFPTSLAVAAYPMFIPLLVGATLCTLDVRSVGLEPVAGFLADERITLAYMAPTVVRFLVDALAGRTFPNLRLIALGGELVDADVVQLTSQLFSPDLIANGFGTTETGVITLYLLDPSSSVEGAVPAGHPVADVEVFVLDDDGAPVPAGTAGEVAVSSPYVFAGYWNHPELDAQVLGPDPAGRDGWKLYRTGDLGRLDADGALTVLGRLDTKVKVRGRFVVLGDVEADLHERAEVADAGVVAVTTDGITDLAAVVTAAPGATIDPVAIRGELLDRFEPYRVPARWLVVPELPRLPNGKVDRQALHHLAEAEAALPRTGRQPGGPEEPPPASVSRARAELGELWRLLLPITPDGIDQEFEHLGGHSLLAAQMLVMFEQRTGTLVPMGEMVHNRTIRTLADVVASIRDADDREPSTVAMVQAGSPARPRLWFVPDLPGSSYRVRHVAQHLGADQPVWSFESPLLRGEPNHASSLDAFVARFVRDLLQSQPEGPYHLAGYSFGGICAYQMARQLRAEGHEVAFVGVIDVGPGYRGPSWRGHQSPPWPFFGVPYAPERGASRADVVRHYVDMARTRPLGFVRHLTLRSGLARYADRVRFAADLRRHGRVRPEWRLWYAWEEHWRLAAKAWDRSYTYDGPLDLFWASDTGSDDSTMGWQHLVPDVRIHRFPGFHEGLLEETGAPAVAAAVRPALDRAIGGTAHPRATPEAP